MTSRKFRISLVMELRDDDIAGMADVLGLPPDSPPEHVVHQHLSAFYADTGFEDLSVTEEE